MSKALGNKVIKNTVGKSDEQEFILVIQIQVRLFSLEIDNKLSDNIIFQN